MPDKEYKYTVEGLGCSNREYADVLAERFHKRYNARRTIQIINKSTGFVERTIRATKPTKPECPDTIDMFS